MSAQRNAITSLYAMTQSDHWRDTTLTWESHDKTAKLIWAGCLSKLIFHAPDYNTPVFPVLKWDRHMEHKLSQWYNTANKHFHKRITLPITNTVSFNIVYFLFLYFYFFLSNTLKQKQLLRDFKYNSMKADIFH